MRIGIDASRAFIDQPTGTERYAYELISRIVQLPETKEHHIILYTKSHIPHSQLQIISKYSNVKIQKIGLPRLWTQLGLAARTWIDNLDVLWVPAHTLPVLRKPGIKTVVTIHGIEYEWLPAYENRLQRWYLPLSTQYAVKTASWVIAVSEFTKAQLIERLGATSTKIQVVHEGYVVNSKFQEPYSKRQSSLQYLSLNHSSTVGEGPQLSVLEKFGLEPGKYILFVGTVQPRKNLERLVEAFQNIPHSKDHVPLKLVIAGKMGWGSEPDSKQQNIVLTGYVTDEEKQVLYGHALFYVQPSITEGFGLPVLEAWAAGLAVASSSGGALKELLTPPGISHSSHNSNSDIAGLLFDPYSVEEMTEAIQKLVSESALREKLARRGKERLRDFSWDTAALETLAVLVS